jgi:hypothetical protein
VRENLAQDLTFYNCARSHLALDGNTADRVYSISTNSVALTAQSGGQPSLNAIKNCRLKGVTSRTKFTEESFKPISVNSPASRPFIFSLRCVVDLQFKTIADYLRVEMAGMPPGAIIDVGAGESP